MHRRARPALLERITIACVGVTSVLLVALPGCVKPATPPERDDRPPSIRAVDRSRADRPNESHAAQRIDPSTPLAAITPATVEPLLAMLIADGPRPSADAARSRILLDQLTTRLEGWGYTVTEELFTGEVYVPRRSSRGSRWRKEERTLVNLIATRRGSIHPERVIEVGAHYDTVHFSPGADDNTSGVVGALEVARVLAAVPLARTVRFCFFAAEEDGMLGSRHHVARIVDREDETLDGFINLEMIGFTATGSGSQQQPPIVERLVEIPDEGTFIAIVGSPVTAEFGDRVIEGMLRAGEDDPEALPLLGLPRLGGWIPDASRSDHAAYWTERLPAVMVTDTADFRNPHYHRASDTIATLDLPFLARVASAVAAATRDLANAPLDLTPPPTPPREAEPVDRSVDVDVVDPPGTSPGEGR